MKTFLLFAFILCTFATNANNYYFSGVSGDDSRTAMQARNPATPWRTVNKLNSVLSTMVPGDSILFKRGETFYGSINLNKSGTLSAPIVIGSYGAGDKPVISSLVTLSNWVSVGNGIYESYSSSLGSTLNMVLLNGAQQAVGRYPNLDEAVGGYLYFEGHSGTTSITDKQLTSAINWTDGEVVVRQRRWKIERAKITSQSGSTINNSGISDEPHDNYGYFIQNHIKTLDEFGEWYYNPSTKKLSVYFGSNSPSSYAVQATALNDIVYSNNASNVVFDNLTFKGGNESCINLNGGSRININSCDILFSGKDAVVVNNHTNFKIEGSTITNSNNNAIDLGHGENAIIRNNKIINTFTFAGMGVNGDGNGVGINSYGDGNLIEFNDVRNTGYIPINFRGDNVTIKNNFIDNFSYVKDDGGGIYTFGASDNSVPTGRKLIGNIIMNGIGAPEGTDDLGLKSAQGIYLDVNASGVEVRDNSIRSVVRGLYMHNAYNIVANNNTFFDNTHQMFIKQDADLHLVRNNTITNNILFAKLPNGVVSTIKSNLNDISLFGRFDSNYYARPLNDRLVIANSYIQSSTYVQVSQSLDLEGWKNAYNKDGNSKRTPKQIAPFRINKLIGASKVVNGTYSSNVNGLSGGSCAVSLGTSGLLDGSYAKLVPSAKGSTVSTSVGSITAGKNYILRYSVKGSSDGSGIIGAFLRQGSSPYGILSATQSYKIGVARIDNELLFTPTTSDASAKIVFRLDEQSTYYLDNIQFYEADAIPTNPDDSIRFEYNASNLKKSVSLDGNYIDVQNHSYSNSVVLQPYTSLILMKTSGGHNAAPTIKITSPAADSNFTAPASININATATDADGSVSKVEFYNGSTLIGTDNSSPYTFTWSNVAAGNYTITAKATDNDGSFNTSNALTVSILKPNEAPSVSVTVPSVDGGFIAPALINISATATDADGSVSKVEFYNGSTLIGTDNSSPYTLSWSNVAAGNYTITAKATDNDGSSTKSTAVTVSVVKPNEAPTVSLNNPSGDFTAPASINLSATVNDADGSISKVEFYNGSTLISTDNSSPYIVTWNNVAAGNYTITAKATDNGGLTATSTAVSVTVTKPNEAPSISLTSPSSNAIFTSPASISITATATDADGSISKVEFYNGGTLVGTDNSSPYTITMSNVATGSYTIMAKATDNGGLATSSNVAVVSVVKPNDAPTVFLTSPSSDASFIAPASINISATANDADGSVSKVEFYNGTTLIGTDNSSPYTVILSNVAIGNYTITAKATDNSGLFTTSNAITVSVVKPNEAPTTSVSVPSVDGGFIAPASMNINATAADADGSISKVEFYNGSTLIGTDNSSPYTLTWNNVSAGDYSITAKATDNGGMSTESQAVTVTVVKPNEAPSVSLNSPSGDFTAPASITISATAADADGSVSQVEFYNGSTLIGTDNSSPYTFTWSNVSTGNYSITAKATDNGGLSTTSDAVIVAVTKVNEIAPTVSLTSPVTDGGFKAPASINISATAADADGSISKVEFYNGSTLLAVSTALPYTWNWQNVPAGTYTITAVATDNHGLTSTSAATAVTVTEDVAPVVDITSPSVNSTFNELSAVNITATATDTDGSVSKVDFYNGNTLMGTDYTSPYAFNWQNVPAGNYAITVKATDNDGLVTSSTATTFSVDANSTMPTVVITSPDVNRVYHALAAIHISADANDANGSIRKVEFYNGNTLLSTQKYAPYSYDWNDVPAGSYKITAKAYDNDGMVTTSAIVVAIVTVNNAPTVKVTSPSVSTNYSAASAMRLTADAADTDGKITKVEFYNGTTLLTTERYLPYSWSWKNVSAGTYTITAKAYDNDGVITTSAPVTIVVSSPVALQTLTSSNIAISSRPANSDVALMRDVAGNTFGSILEAVSLHIGPNPTSDVLSVFTKGLQQNKEVKISIYTMSGILIKTLTSNTANQVTQVNVSSFRAGQYSIRVASGDAVYNMKFQKQ